ncbi:MAG: hypothetical protein DI551_06185 [Micavibrio aeruginosavorus]|uniref:Uncharacterized protein n=1 Tax=Micavibrio aeruginosavorus TaxID=349221 RepID=A0A2W5N0J3_9BACT|nr:MAG: hypothetical protein DI551_06185 [Micavibrio aeruginosavorus]
MVFMGFQTSHAKIGYSRYEFGKIFQIYSQNVYAGLFRDFSFTEINGQFFISFREEAGKTPLITVEKRRLGPDTNLFVATTPGPKGQPVEIVRSEKIDLFAERLKDEINEMRENKTHSGLRVVS